MKKILVINGHPDHQSLNSALARAYSEGAAAAGASVEEINISELSFNPNLQFGYRKRTELESDLVTSWDKIIQADHLVWIHPVWWGGMPAMMKGFIDRLFLPGRAFEYRANSIFWKKLLKGKTAHIITTLDQPGWYYWLKYGRPSVNQLKRSVLEFCGVSPVTVSCFGIVKTSSAEQRELWIKQVEAKGRRMV